VRLCRSSACTAGLSLVRGALPLRCWQAAGVTGRWRWTCAASACATRPATATSRSNWRATCWRCSRCRGDRSGPPWSATTGAAGSATCSARGSPSRLPPYLALTSPPVGEPRGWVSLMLGVHLPAGDRGAFLVLPGPCTARHLRSADAAGAARPRRLRQETLASSADNLPTRPAPKPVE